MRQASVLVVEDNDLERQITADTLREEGFAVEEAAVGKRAMELLALGQFDVVLTDLLMPGMSGDELLAKVRAAYPATQVVMLTAHGTIDSAVKAMKTGAFYYLTKPTDRETLVMAVAKAGLESTVRYLAFNLGSRKIRVNAISAGPIKTLAARGVGDLSDMMKSHADRSPLHRNVDQLEVGGAALFLASELSSAITGEIMYVDCGYNIMGF